MVKIDDATPFATVKQLRLVFPYLQKAIERQYYNPLLPWVKKSDVIKDFLKEIFAPPASHEEEVIMIVADILVDLIVDPVRRIAPIISAALPEIEEAYNVVLQDGGGWSSRGGKSERRKAATFAWFDQNKARMSYLNKSHLQDLTLYNDGAGQDKRNFYIHLILKIVKERAHRIITFNEILNYMRRTKKEEREFSKTLLDKVLAKL